MILRTTAVHKGREGGMGGGRQAGRQAGRERTRDTDTERERERQRERDRERDREREEGEEGLILYRHTNNCKSHHLPLSCYAILIIIRIIT